MKTCRNKTELLFRLKMPEVESIILYNSDLDLKATSICLRSLCFNPSSQYDYNNSNAKLY